MEGLKHIETLTSENEKTKNMVLTLKMVFEAPDYFANPSGELVVSLEYESEDAVRCVTGTNIEWLEGQDPTKKKIKKKQKHKKTGETRTVVKTVDADSFFNVFADRKAPGEAEGDSEEENDAQDKLDEVQQIVEDFHDLLVPEALEYYLNMNEDFDMMGMDEGGESGSDEGDSEDGEDKKPTAKKAGANPSTGTGEEKQECKQQ